MSTSRRASDSPTKLLRQILLATSMSVALAASNAASAQVMQPAPTPSTTTAPSNTTPVDPQAADTPLSVQTKAEETTPVASTGLSNDSTTTPAADIIVTGSSIRGVAPTGSNLIAVGRDTITANAPANTAELLQTVPQLGNFNGNMEATSNRFRTPGFQANIHNLGIYATLTLFNGHRMAPVGGEAVFPDSSIIPVIAIQRVEVIADGASAVYGSDAVAGVVNFIYRKNVDGVEASATYGYAPDNPFRKYDASLLMGKTWNGGGFMAAYEFSKNNSPLNGDIDFIRSDQTFRGGVDRRAAVCPTPNVRIGNTTYAYNPTTDTLRTGSNKCETLLNSNIVPNGERHAFLVTAHQDVTSNIEAWTELNYSVYRTRRNNNPRTITLSIPTTSIFYRPFGTATPAACPNGIGRCETLTRSTLGLFPNPRGIQRSEELAFTGGLDIKLGHNWVANVMAHYSKTNDYNSDPEVDLVVAQNLLNAGLFNPYLQADQVPEAIRRSINNGYTQSNKASQFLREFQAKADGPLVQIGGGDVRAAVGLDVRQDQTKQLQLGGAPGPTQLTVRDDNLKRLVVAGFAEAHVPFFGPDNARPGINKLELAVSGRYDHYQTYGGTFNPKFGLIYEPVSSLAMRASYGKSFVAPNLGMVTSTFAVPQAGQNIPGVGTINQLNLGGGNPNLTPERAKTYSVGLDFKPVFLRGLRASGTYYHVHYANLLYKPTQGDLYNDPAFAAYITRPSAPGVPLSPAYIAQLLALYPPQSPSPPYYDYVIGTYTINVGVRKISGLDLDASYRFGGSRIGQFVIAANANRQLHYKQKISPTQPFTDLVGTYIAPKWRMRTSVSWSLDPIALTVSDSYTGTYLNNTVTPNQQVKAYNTVDVTASYTLANWGKGTQFQFRAVNVFNKQPPFYDSNLGYNPTYSTPFGRTLEGTIRVKL